MKNKVLYTITVISVITLLLSIITIDSATWIPKVITAVDLTWITLFLFVNKSRFNQEQEERDGMKEKDFEKKVKQFLKEKGCWTLKTWSNGIQREGVPDLLVCCNGFFVGVELKAEKGHPSELQLWNIEKIRTAGGYAIVLYPDQFDDFKAFINDLIANGTYYSELNRKDVVNESI